MKILTFDIATNVGWACHANGVITHGEASMKRIHGLKRTPDEHLGAAYFKFRNFVSDMIHLNKPELLITEYTGYFKSAAARDICCGFRGILMECAARHGLPLVSYSPATIKRHWSGKGNADKDAMVAAGAKKGWGTLGPDECDALAMLDMVLHLKGLPKPTPAPGAA